MIFSSSFLVLYACVAVSLTFSASSCVMQPPAYADSSTFASYYVPAENTRKATWDIHEVCSDFRKGDQVCCSENQYKSMRMQFAILNATMVGCEACKMAFYKAWCHFTCAPNQSDFISIRSYVPNNPKKDKRIQSVYFNITKGFADRYWDSCQNAGFRGTSSFKYMFLNGAEGLFNMMASRSPGTEPPNEHLVHAILVDHSPFSKAMNLTLYNDQFACSSTELEKVNYFPMPRARVGKLSLLNFALISYCTLLVAVFLVGIYETYGGEYLWSCIKR
ncbi:hypothetical protein XU18_1868 [Perkinsela sp. CCAP 1560/4]|nr:hypothetical protein XU18_1868 [Perkinsela sp. CCAP 1560/4]|eukprot:KNH07336.1 hypothetical protein XU18_1868 [Perkinsela sp. CCAP 1560/4]